MSKPGTPSEAGARLRQHFSTMHKSRRQGSLGIAEIIGLGVGSLLLLAAVVAYLSFMVPAQSRVAALLLERDRLQKQVRISQDDLQQGVSTQSRVEKITESLDKFETVSLIDRSAGRMLLYDDLNQLIGKNGLRNTSGPTYTTLEPLGSRSAEQAAVASANSAAAKWQSIYPGIAVNVTVEGPYQSVRHFVRDLETSKEFIIINGVELEQAQSNQQPLTTTSAPKASAASAPVSLRLDLATYFQRGTEPAKKTPS